MRSTVVLGLVLAASAVAQPAERELVGELERAPLRLAGHKLQVEGALVGVLDRAAEAAPRVRARVIRVGEDGLPLIGRKGAVSLVAVEGRLVADVPLREDAEMLSGQLEANPARVRANTPVWVVSARAARGGVWLRVQRAPESSDSRWVEASLVRIGGDPVGQAVGEALAPAFAASSRARGARTFHPDGTVYAGVVESLQPELPWVAAAQRLEGRAVVRVGAGLLKMGQLPMLPDLLSVAIRLKGAGQGTPNLAAEAGDQDLFLTADAERFGDFFNPLTPLLAEEHDYFQNTYHAALPFLLEGTGKRVWVRVVPVPFTPADAALRDPSGPEAREEKLRQAVAAGQARFRIEVQPESRVGRALGVDHGWFDLISNDWIPLAELSLTEGPLAVDQEAMRYHPELAGRGIVPVGPIAGVRPAVYRASQEARPATAAERAEGDGFLGKLRRP